MTFDDIFLLTTSANVTKSNVFGKNTIKNAVVLKGFLYCDVSMVYTRFGGFFAALHFPTFDARRPPIRSKGNAYKGFRRTNAAQRIL